MLDFVLQFLECFLYYRASRVFAWTLGAAGAASLILAAIWPDALWFGFVMSPVCFVGCIASVVIGNWFEAYAESRERERSWRTDVPAKQPPVRGFSVIPSSGDRSR